MRRLLDYHPIALDFALLLLRACSGAVLLTHGWPKLADFSARASKFADPYGLGSEVSLGLAVFAEVFCSALLIIGWYTRFALVPLIVTMATIILVVHGSDPFAKKELAVMFLIPFVVLFFTGPGKYSVDGLR